MTAATQSKAKPGLWAGLFVANMAIIAALSMAGAIEGTLPAVLIALNMGLIVPMVRAAKARQEEKGAMSPALRRYNTRFLSFSAAYLIAMIGGGMLFNRLEPAEAAMWVVAIVPMLPAFGMIWSMMQYLREETDEYLRHRAVRAALIGLGFILVIGTGWGFLESFGLAPHVWAWWVFPAWAIGLAIGMAIPERVGEAG